MSKVAMLYMSREGQTRKIIERIQTVVARKGHEVDVIDLEKFQEYQKLPDYDAFMLGCSIRYGKHHAEFRRFVEQCADILNSKPCYFFSVNLTARKPNRSEPYMNRYLVRYLESSPLVPDHVEVFAGALRFSTYNYFETQLIRLIMVLNDGPTDPAQDIEFTDWARVIRFAEKFVTNISEQKPLSRPEANAMPVMV